MSEFNAYIFFPLLVGIILLFIEYGIIQPLQKKEKPANNAHSSHTVPETTDDPPVKLAFLGSDLLFSRTVFSNTVLTFLKLTFFVFGFGLTLSTVIFISIFLVSVFGTSIEFPFPEFINVYMPILVPSLLVIGLALLWVDVQLLKEELSRQNKNFVVSFAKLSQNLLWGTILFNTLWVIYFAIRVFEGGWVGVVNALSGIFFCIYLDTAIQRNSEKERETREE